MYYDERYDKLPMNTRGQRWQAYGAALLSGMVGLPLILLTLNTLPIILPAMLYSALAFFFTWLIPSRSGFRWAMLITFGIPLAVLLGIVTGFFEVPLDDPSNVPLPFASLWGAMLLTAIVPALVGSMAGGVLGGWYARRTRRRG
ncbi:MAG: hypothetical protein KDD73_13505 [Anaerolineales bacterium]|nr:hypothetical protein [Anaerolineales bacterium]MCB9128035.1 hypothetical protein [Ardenticatenales bacterium]MCB9172051.1 hypothetical protein [Ardenticatenales bacterium]